MELKNKYETFSHIFENSNNYRNFLEKYKISQEFAFMSYFNINEIEIKNSFIQYEQLSNNLFEIINSNTIISEVANLSYKTYDLELLKEEKFAMKIYVILTYIINAYLPIAEEKIIPDTLGIPLIASSSTLQIRPCWTYTNNTHCVEIIDKSKLITLDNIRMKITHTNTQTEEYFYLISYITDVRISEIIDIIYQTNHIIYKHTNSSLDVNFDEFTETDNKELSKSMDRLIDMLSYLKTISKEIFNKVDPDVFYNNLRKYVKGYSYYGGVKVCGQMLNYPGGSAGQNPFIFCIKSLFGIEVPDRLKDYHTSLIDAFRKPHMEFIEIIKDISLIYKLEFYKPTEDKYKKCKRLLNDFYLIHKAYVRKYIEEPASLNGVDITKIKGSGESDLDWVKNLNVHYKLSDQ